MHAARWAPIRAERDIILEALAELPDPGGGARAVARAGGLRRSALADTANLTALSTEHKVANGPRTKQLSTSRHLLTILSPCHPTHPPTLIF